MKLDMKKFRLAAAAFICGFVFCAVLVTLTQEQPAPVAVAPRLASAQIATPFVFHLPPDTSDPGMIRVGDGPSPSEPRRFDLIDQRPQLDHRDLK